MIDLPALHLTQNVWKWLGARLGPSVFPPLFSPFWQEERSSYSLCCKLDHLLAGTISHCDQRLHVELLLTQDQEALLPWKQNNNTSSRAVQTSFKWALQACHDLKASELSVKQCMFVQVKRYMSLRMKTVSPGSKDPSCHLQVNCQTFVNRAFSLKRTVKRKGDCYLPNTHTPRNCMNSTADKIWGQYTVRPPRYFDVCWLCEKGVGSGITAMPQSHEEMCCILE